MSDDIKFTQEEWQRANDLAVHLLRQLGPKPQGGCETCNPPAMMLPNYAMKYELALALRALAN